MRTANNCCEYRYVSCSLQSHHIVIVLFYLGVGSQHIECAGVSILYIVEDSKSANCRREIREIVINTSQSNPNPVTVNSSQYIFYKLLHW